jgi:hypothetical protein
MVVPHDGCRNSPFGGDCVLSGIGGETLQALCQRRCFSVALAHDLFNVFSDERVAFMLD